MCVRSDGAWVGDRLERRSRDGRRTALAAYLRVSTCPDEVASSVTGVWAARPSREEGIWAAYHGDIQ